MGCNTAGVVGILCLAHWQLHLLLLLPIMSKKRLVLLPQLLPACMPAKARHIRFCSPQGRKSWALA
jgi:hypothetical protein